MNFFKESIKNLKRSGSLTPSSRYLIAQCLEGVDFTKAQTILELGVGDGCITQEILEKSNPTCRIIALEINENLFEYAQKKFIAQENLKLHLASAFDFDKILEQENVQEVDYIISSLPLSLFKSAEIEHLFAKIQKHLSPSGVFVQYQYSIGKYAYLKTVFSDVKVGFTLLNAPPALIFTCANL